uniref:Uncharacterized protein n=1 Tax=uncultured marine virus TaxID=186617 RepID=A0A0F7LA27_9VIRU|nr:hypothetical protein [uncultured marine virus]
MIRIFILLFITAIPLCLMYESLSASVEEKCPDKSKNGLSSSTGSLATSIKPEPLNAIILPSTSMKYGTPSLITQERTPYVSMVYFDRGVFAVIPSHSNIVACEPALFIVPIQILSSPASMHVIFRFVKPEISNVFAPEVAKTSDVSNERIVVPFTSV